MALGTTNIPLGQTFTGEEVILLLNYKVEECNQHVERVIDDVKKSSADFAALSEEVRGSPLAPHAEFTAEYLDMVAEELEFREYCFV